jgi:hypothetical protein
MNYLHWKPSADDMALAINDRGYIPGLKKLGMTPDEIARIRRYDKLGQGNPWEQVLVDENLAKRDLDDVPVFDGLFLLDPTKLRAKEDMVKDAIATASETPVADIFTVKGNGFGFSGSPAAVQRFLDFDFGKYGLAKGEKGAVGDYAQYGGGDPNASRFCGFKIESFAKQKLLKDPKFLTDVWKIFRPDTEIPKQYFEAFGVKPPKPKN